MTSQPLVVILTSLLVIAGASPVAAQSDLADRARALQREVPLIDGHNDYPCSPNPWREPW